MAKYAVDTKPSARRELEKLSNSLIARLVPKDRRPGCRSKTELAARKLRGYKDLWRIRVGNYRVVYIIDDDRKMVSVTRIAHRKDVYE